VSDDLETELRQAVAGVLRSTYMVTPHMIDRTIERLADVVRSRPEWNPEAVGEGADGGNASDARAMGVAHPRPPLSPGQREAIENLRRTYESWPRPSSALMNAAEQVLAVFPDQETTEP
jgi:hypothetical protein